MLAINTPAPDFTLCDASGQERSLSDFKGKKVILYFYPKDNTPGCTRQACAFKNQYEAFKAVNAEIIGISKDSAASHQKFIQKYELPFLLLSDPELTAIQAYDVWHKKKMAGREYMGVVRSTYIIDENGKILQAYEKVNPEKDPLIVLEALKSI